jgi:hypothetical protein
VGQGFRPAKWLSSHFRRLGRLFSYFLDTLLAGSPFRLAFITIPGWPAPDRIVPLGAAGRIDASSNVCA